MDGAPQLKDVVDDILLHLNVNKIYNGSFLKIIKHNFTFLPIIGAMIFLKFVLRFYYKWDPHIDKAGFSI